MTDYQDMLDYSGPDLDNPYTFRENLGSAKPRKLESFSVARLRPLAMFLVRGLLYTRGIWLAGGALQTLVDPSETINDYDLFFQNGGAAESARNKLA